MCGICGFFDPDRELSIGPEHLQRMVSALHHRGPDEKGVEYRPSLGLAIARLSIMDVQEGHQPYFSEDRQVVAVFNGEIYNFPELRANLLSRGHRLNSRADGEVLVHLYEELGERFVERLNGMFAIALMDFRSGRFFLFRDRLGIKPLYYYRRGRGLVFASQPSAIFESGCLEPTLDLASLDQYLAFEFLPNPASIYAEIRKLPPAHLLSERGVERYWQLAPRDGAWEASAPRSLEEWVDELRQRLADAVQRQLLSDVPLGMFLSGGLDSSTVTALAQQSSGGRFKTFSVGFEEASFDESRQAREVALLLGSQHHSEVLRSSDVMPLVRDLIHGLDEPLADPAVVPTFLLSRLARQHVTVVLSGEGADELLGGYPTYLAHQLADALKGWGPALSLAQGVLQWVPPSTGYMSWEFKAKRFLAHATNRQWEGSLRHQLWMGAAEPGLRSRLYTPAMAQALGQRDGFEALRQLRADQGPQGWARFAWQDIQYYLAEGLLVKLDRATMATSLEGRVPYLDHTLVEFLLGVPARFKRRGKWDKWLLRQVATRYLTPSVAWRAKKGFGLPLTRWLKDVLRDELSQSLDFLAETGLFARSALTQLSQEHLQRRHDRRKELWTLLMLAQWWRRWRPRLPG